MICDDGSGAAGICTFGLVLVIMAAVRPLFQPAASRASNHGAMMSSSSTRIATKTQTSSGE
jgi:hypothetical protein